MRKLVIDRKKWHRGKRSYTKETGQSCLLRPEDGKMCCLGFYMKSVGFTDEEILARPMPARIVDIEKVPTWLVNTKEEEETANGKRVFLSSEEAEHLARLNDENAVVIKEPEREAEIAKIFAQNDVEVEFVN